jgi:hypothetical protein
MSSRSLSVLVDTEHVKPTVILGRVARAGSTVSLTHRMFADLAAELGDHDAACRWLVDLAQEVDRPVLVNMPTGPDTSTTVALAPFWWGEERLRGYVGGLREEIEEQFGPAVVRPPGGGEHGRPERES